MAATTTVPAFTDKWVDPKGGFADNTMEKITEGTFRDFAGDNATLHGRGPNQRATGRVSVVFLTQAEADAAGRGECATLEGLDPEILYTGMEARVDLHPDQYGQALELVYDSRPAGSPGRLRAFIDGSLTPYPRLTNTPDGKNPVYWAKRGTVAQQPNVPLLDPKRTDYPATFTVQYELAGKSYLFRTSAAGGPFPAPTTVAGTADWLPVAESAPPAARSIDYALDYMQQVLVPAKKCEAGLQYRLTGPWDAGHPLQVVYVTAAGPDSFEAIGTLFTGVIYKAVIVDVVAGTTSELAGNNEGRIQLVTDQGLRVAVLVVEETIQVGNVRLFDLASQLYFQVNKRVNGNWQPGLQQALGDLNTTLAALTPAELASGVEIEMESMPVGKVSNQFTALLTVSGLPGFSMLRGTRPARRVFNPNASPEPTVGFQFNALGKQNQSFSFPNPALNEGSIRFWMKRNAQPGAGNEYWFLGLRPANLPYIGVDNNAGNNFYVEGQVRTNSLMGSPASIWVPIHINLPFALQAGTINLFSGVPGGGNGPIDVEIFDLRFYSRVFLNSEIVGDRTAVPADSLLARFSFPYNLDPNLPVTDESGNGNHGTLYGF